MEFCESKRKRIQILRGVAIIAVVAIHCLPSGVCQVFVRPFLNFSVGLFLFLSGYLSNIDKWKPKKRIMKVIIPYIFWTFVYVVISYWDSIKLIPIKYIEGIFTGKSAAIMYYIFVYCQFTLLIPVIDKMSKSKMKYLGFFLAPLEIISMRLIPIILGYSFNDYIIVVKELSCIAWFSYFYFGYVLGNGRMKCDIKNKTTIVLLIISLFIQMLEGFGLYLLGVENCGTQLKLSSILSGMLYMIIAYDFINKPQIPTNKLLMKLGDFSFGIYFSHLAIMSVINKIPYYSKVIIFPLNVIITIIIACFCICIGRKILGKNSKYLAL